MVIHPDQFQVETPFRRKLMTHANVNPVNYEIELPQRFLLDHCRLRGLTCLDLLRDFGRQGARGGLYLERDTHYNARGNDLAARLISDFLASEGLITGP